MDFAGFPSLAGLDRAIAVIVVSEIGDKTFLMFVHPLQRTEDLKEL